MFMKLGRCSTLFKQGETMSPGTLNSINFARDYLYNSNEFIDLVGMMYRLELLTKIKYVNMLMNSVNYRRGL